MSSPAKASDLALAVRDRKAELAARSEQRKSMLVVEDRLNRALPGRVTRREKQAGREAAYRGTVAEATRALHYEGAVAAARIVDHGQAVNQTLIGSINERVRQVSDPEDRAEIAENAEQWKAMGTRQQLGMAEAAVSNIAGLIDKPIYRERKRGVLAAVGATVFGE